MKIRSRLFIATAAIIIALTILHISRIAQPAEEAARFALLPIGRFFAAAGVGARDMLVGSPEFNEFRDRNAELEARMRLLVLDYVRLRALEEENRSLTALLTFKQQSGYDSVPARVIVRSVNPNSATVVIDRGSKDGVEIGMAVVAGNGILVGKVTNLKERVSTVTLISDESSRLAAAAAGGNRLFGLVEGGGNKVARLTLVPQSEPLQRDDIIVTAGTEEKVPPNLVIGIVNEVRGTDTDPFKSATIEPLAKSDKLNIVMVLRPGALRPE